MSCKSQDIIDSKKEESQILMSTIFSDFENSEQSITISNKILYSVSSSDINNWQQLIENSKMILPMAITYNTKDNKEKVDYTLIFTKDEIVHMSNQIIESKAKTWRNYLGLESNKKDGLNLKTYYLSIPVFTINKDYALIYLENTYGGTLKIYKKSELKWKAIASATVWIN